MIHEKAGAGELFEPETDDDFQAFLESLRLLAANQRPAPSNSPPYLVSNDKGYQEIAPAVIEHILEKPLDLGVFVGGGGLPSWLPDLRPSAAIMIDINPSVLEFNQLLIELIKQCGSPAEVMDNLSQYKSADQKIKDYIFSGAYNWELHAESNSYGPSHWTNESRFFAAKAALQATPTIFLNADVSDPDFNIVFGQITQVYGRKISFANLTNVADYTGSVDFISSWPLTDDPMIVYSANGLPKDSAQVEQRLSMRLARTANEYKLGVIKGN